MGINITGDSSLATNFINEWHNSCDYIIAHTSGSTGTPKPIHLKKSDMAISAKATNTFFGITSQSTLALPLSMDYIAGKMMVVRAIEAGCKIWIEKPSMTPFKNAPDFDLGAVVPAQLPYILESSDITHKAKAIIIGGAPISDIYEDLVISSGLHAYATYGMTETCSHVALRKIGELKMFKALPGITFSIDSRGCLIINANKYSFKSISTNDVVNLISDTQFQWLGRADNIINTGGLKVCAEQIEELIKPLIPDRSFYISGAPDEFWGTRIELTVQGTDFNTKAFLAKAQCVIPRKFIPKRIHIVENIPHTSSGKIIRNNHNVQYDSRYDNELRHD